MLPSEMELDYPTILDFPAPHLRCYSKESTVAEKFESAVGHGDLNSRMKDFFDIWFLSSQFDFDGATLAKAINEVFSRRGTELSPERVPLRPTLAQEPSKAAQWRAFRKRSRLDSAPENFAELMTAVATFLQPVAAAIHAGYPFKARWSQSGRWSKTGLL